MADVIDDIPLDAARPSVDTRDILNLARMLRHAPRVPLSTPEGWVDAPIDGHEGKPMYNAAGLPTLDDLQDRAGHHMRGAAQNAFMMMGYGTGPAGLFSSRIQAHGAPLVDAARDVGKAVLEHPRIAAALGAIPGMMASSGADTGQGPGPRPVDFEPPTLASELKDAALRYFKGDGAVTDDQRPLTLEQYKEKNRRFTPKTEADFIKEKLDALHDSEEYKKSQSKGYRDNRDAAATQQGREAYISNTKSLGDEDARLVKDYGSYKKGWEDQRLEYLSKPFVDRNPIAGTMLTYGPPIASALMARGIMGAVNSKGAKIARAGETAREADNVRLLADNIAKAERYKWVSPVAKAAGLGEAALLPIEGRATMDFGDAYGLPPDAPASIKAQERLSDWGKYLTRNEQNLVTGAIGTLGGVGWSKLPQARWGLGGAAQPGVDLAVLRSHARGLGPTEEELTGWQRFLPSRKLAPDEMAIGLAERAAAAKEAQARLTNAGRPPIALEAEAGTALPAPAREPLQIEAPKAAAPEAAVVSPAPDQSPTPRPRLADRVKAADQRLQREAVPSSDQRVLPSPSSSPTAPKWAIDMGYSPHPNGLGQLRRPDGTWGESIAELSQYKSRRAWERAQEAKAKSESTAETTPGKGEQSANGNAEPIVKPDAPIQDDLAPYGRSHRRNGRANGEDQSSLLGAYLRSMA